jgi:small-conductance mechanosensitive channel
MHKDFITRGVLVALLLASTAGMAQNSMQQNDYRYRWNDDHGQMHFSDSLNAEAIKNGYDVLNSNGLVVRHVQRQLSPAERKIADAKEAKQKAVQAAAARQHAEDMQMLNAYPNVRVFRDAQQAEINELEQSVRTTQINLHAQEQNLAELLSHVADLKHQGKPVPAFMQKRIDSQRAAVNDQRATLARQQAAKDAAVKKVAERIARYKKLQAEQNPDNL